MSNNPQQTTSTLLSTCKMPLLLPCMMVLLAISLLVRGGAADRVPAVIVFGDSTADIGNKNFI